MSRKSLTIVLVAMLILIAAPAAFAAAGGAAIYKLTTMPLMAAAGPDAAAIYKGKCAVCHGADGAGQTLTGKKMKARDLRSPEVQKMSDKELTTIITDGKGKMPAYKAKLAPADISALVKLIRKMKK